MSIFDELKKFKNSMLKMGLPTISNHDETEKSSGREPAMAARSSNKDRLAKDMMADMFKGLGVKAKRSVAKKENDGLTVRNYIMVGGKLLCVKLILIYESEIVTVSLWEQHEQKMLGMICSGRLRDHRRLSHIGQEHLGQWI